MQVFGLLARFENERLRDLDAALRKAVQQRLSRMKCVKSYRNGLYGEGEEGVTVVTLR